MKKTVVFLPGWGFDQSIWEDFVEPLANKINPIFLDWNHLEDVNDINTIATEVIAELRKDKSEIIVVGWSLGTLVALDLAKNFPEVSRLILFAPTSSFVQRDEYPIGWDARVVRRMKRQLGRDTETVKEQFAEQVLTVAEQKLFRVELSETQTKNSLMAGLDYLIVQDSRMTLADIKQPTLIIQGEADQICPQAGAVYIAEHVAGIVSTLFIKGAGHAPFITKRELCLERVRDFLGVG